MQFSNRKVLTLILTCFCQLPDNVSTLDQKPSLGTGKASKYNFGKLLNSIIALNQERLEALKKYNALDKYNLAHGTLRGADDRKLDPMIAVLLLNKNVPDSKVYEIFDSDVTNTHGKTPVRDILQRIEDHYNHNPDEDKEVKNDMFNFEDDNTNQKIFYATREGIDIADEEAITPNIVAKQVNRLVSKGNTDEKVLKRTEVASDEEGNSIPSKKYVSLKEMPDGEVIIHVKDKPKHSNDLSEMKNYRVGTTQVKNVPDKNKPSDKELSDDEVIIHGHEKIKLTNNLVKDKKQILRLFKSCSKGMIKRCKKACKKAYKAGCDTYKCSKGMKKRMGKSCKSKCKEAFEDD